VIGELTEALERERRRARQLELAQEALLERAARRHELVSRLGHELRTPVTVILGMAQTLVRGTSDEAERDELLMRIVERAEDLARLVERFELTMDANLTERVDVIELVSEVTKGEPRVSVTSAGRLPRVAINPVVGRRVLTEIVDNALRFSPQDAEVNIWVTLDTDCVELRVSDQGPGIPPAARERIFEALEQLEELNSRVHQGAGLGLTLARAAARSMGGDVVLEPSDGPGSTFLWTIAVERAEI
jgi:signal transduction histidine kinase